MRTITPLLALLAVSAVTTAHAAPCLKITLTGTQGGPPVYQEFATGRGTTQRLSQAKTPVGKLNGIFLSHMHSDHTEGLADMMQLRWHFGSGGPKVDLVCSEDAVSPAGHTLSCTNFAEHIGDALINSGEISQRLVENKKRLPGGPKDLLNVMPFTPGDEPATVWSSGDVTVKAVGSRHIPGHASYRVDTPAGSVVIGGDAGNDKPPWVQMSLCIQPFTR